MKLFDYAAKADFQDELIVDSFAGGGGASTGIEMALGRSPNIAINHDAEALALHRANHPDTLHLSKNVWHVDPLEAVGNRRVGLAWFSPDCKHFSRAKGGKPVKRNIRDLAWVVVLWAKRARPRVIVVENVEEFLDWGPLVEKEPGRYVPCAERKGKTFEKWAGELKRLGYRIEWKKLKACDYGAPTIRQRLFVIARCDGEPIVWPTPTHGAPDSDDVREGRKAAWRTAGHDVIDFSLPCPSIFMTREEAKQYRDETGIRVNRPLADNTMKRIAKGVQRYVIEAEQPFIVNLTHHGSERVEPLDEPMRTITGAHRGEKALVMPHLEYAQHGGASRPATAPVHTVTASKKDQNLLVAAHLTKFRTNSVGKDMRAPVPTVTANSFIQRPGGAPPMGVVAAFLAQHSAGSHPGRPARGAEEPVSTITQTGSQQALVATHMMSLKGSDRRDGEASDPLPTVCAGGGHAAEVRAFMMKYYSVDQDPRMSEPLHTVTTKDRFGLVMVAGEQYRIVDIGMRMLTPRELFRAQGFPESYAIDHGIDENGERIKLTGTASIRMCGNSVCPPLAAAIVKANYIPAIAKRDAA